MGWKASAASGHLVENSLFAKDHVNLTQT